MEECVGCAVFAAVGADYLKSLFTQYRMRGTVTVKYIYMIQNTYHRIHYFMLVETCDRVVIDNEGIYKYCEFNRLHKTNVSCAVVQSQVNSIIYGHSDDNELIKKTMMGYFTRLFLKRHELCMGVAVN